MKKIFSIVLVIIMAFSTLTLFVGCGIDMSFSARCKTSEDGFVYYEDSKIGLCIISLPDSEEVAIPEFIDVTQRDRSVCYFFNVL